MISIKKNDSRSDWLLVDADFRSLQMCIAMADCGLNKHGIDKVCYDIYGPGGSNDAHSVTAFSTFMAPIHFPVIEIEDEKGNKTVFCEEQEIKIKRKNLAGGFDDLTIQGKDFKEDDIFVSY